jgi:homocitrate synthase NifV
MPCNDSRQHVTIVDSTLRDGAQAPGVVLSASHRLKIADLLIGAGLTDLDAGIPAMGPDEGKLLRTLTNRFPGKRIVAWCRALPKDLDAAEKSGCCAVHIAFPLSELHLASINRNHEWLFSSLAGLVGSARHRFSFVSVGLIDATRADRSLLIRFCQRAEAVSADRVRLADTVGILTPTKTARLFNDLRSVVNLKKIDFHAHNDLGMATANAVTAVDSGVGSISVTVNGLGERAGNAALEEVAIALHLDGTIPCPLDLSKIQELCETVAGFSGRPIPPSKPVSGEAVFLHESGIHWSGLLKDPRTFEPFSPSLTGHKLSAPVAGSHSGGATVIALLRRSGMTLSTAEASLLAAKVRHRAIELGRSLTIREVERACIGQGGYPSPRRQ